MRYLMTFERLAVIFISRASGINGDVGLLLIVSAFVRTVADYTDVAGRAAAERRSRDFHLHPAEPIDVYLHPRMPVSGSDGGLYSLGSVRHISRRVARRNAQLTVKQRGSRREMIAYALSADREEICHVVRDVVRDGREIQVVGVRRGNVFRHRVNKRDILARAHVRAVTSKALLGYDIVQHRGGGGGNGRIILIYVAAVCLLKLGIRYPDKFCYIAERGEETERICLFSVRIYVADH